MGDPVTTAIAGGILSGVGSLQEGVAGKQQARFNERVARNNAIIAQRKAADIREIGKAEVRKQQIQTNLAIGQQRAAAAAAGVVTDFGSALDITADTAAFGKLDELIIAQSAEREALGFEGKAAEFQAQRQAFKAQGKAEFISGVIGAGTNVLGGFTTASQLEALKGPETASKITEAGVVSNKWRVGGRGTTQRFL